MVAEKNFLAGERAYLNSGRPVTVVRTEEDAFGVWVIYDVDGTLDREQVAERNIHREPPAVAK